MFIALGRMQGNRPARAVKMMTAVVRQAIPRNRNPSRQSSTF